MLKNYINFQRTFNSLNYAFKSAVMEDGVMFVVVLSVFQVVTNSHRNLCLVDTRHMTKLGKSWLTDKIIR